MGNDAKFDEFDLFIQDCKRAGEPEPNPLDRLRPMSAADRQKLIVGDINRTAARGPDPLDVEQSLMQERARATFLTPDQLVVTFDGLGQMVVKAGDSAPLQKTDFRPEQPDPFLTALTEGIDEHAAAPYNDPEGRALAALGIGAPVPVEMAPTLSVPAAPATGSGLAKAEDDLPCLRGSLADVLDRVAARMPVERSGFTRKLADLARDYEY
jgi:hypothetical protein